MPREIVFKLIAQAPADETFDAMVDRLFGPFTQTMSDIIFWGFDIDGVTLPLVVLWLIAGALFFTIYMRFINIRSFRHAIQVVRGKYDNPDDPGEVTHFQALSAALSGTVGLGNIAGVAIAISVGGPGATFWMILAGLFGMTSKFVECTLGVKYRDIDERGVVSGGPMYYLSKGLANRGWPRLGITLAALSAISVIGGALGSGSLFQVNQAAAQFQNVVVPLTGGENSILHNAGWIFGLIYSFFLGLIIIGGIKKIGHVTEFLVPFMAGIYVMGALVVLFTHASHIPDAFLSIFTGVFSPEGVAGGFIGVVVIGIQRATFSNEAGLGSAPIAHSAVKTTEPVSEGMVALLEPFIDTVVVCTITALVIIIVGDYEGAAEGITLTSRAFATVIGWFPYVLTVAAILFAFSTSITWYYYGERAFVYFSHNSPGIILAYKTAYIATIIIGSAMTLTSIFTFSAAMLFAMAIPNLVGLYIMAPEVKGMLKSYLARVKSGEIKAVK